MFITTKEASRKYSKSISTVKRAIAKADRLHLRYEPNDTAKNRRLFVSIEYLDTCFGVSREPQKDTTNAPANDTVLILQKELQNKQNIIDKLLHNQEAFLERQREMNILLDRSNERANLLEMHFEKNRKKDLKTVDIEEIEEELEEIESTPTNEESKHIDVKDLELSDWFKQFTKPS